MTLYDSAHANASPLRDRARRDSPSRAHSSSALRTAGNELRGRPRSGDVSLDIRYAQNGDVNIAYHVVGEGHFDLVWVTGSITNLEVLWDFPEYRRFCERLGSFSRLICFDKRGTGLSDRVRVGTLEERMDDVRALLDAVESESTALLGISEGGPMSILFAATHPDRTRGLVLCRAPR